MAKKFTWECDECGQKVSADYKNQLLYDAPSHYVRKHPDGKKTDKDIVREIEE